MGYPYVVDTASSGEFVAAPGSPAPSPPPPFPLDAAAVPSAASSRSFADRLSSLRGSVRVRDAPPRRTSAGKASALARDPRRRVRPVRGRGRRRVRRRRVPRRSELM